MAFAHLHVHTEYSLLDGSNKISEYVNRIRELGMSAAAITDHGVMYGVIDFYKAAREAGIRPILGCEVYVAPASRFDREVSQGEERYHHLVLLAKNNTGYANLIKIVSKGFLDGYYYRPRVDREILSEYHEGIIALSACLAGEIPRYLLRGMYDEAREAALWHESCFGKGNFYLELQDHGMPDQALVNQQLMRLHDETGIELVVTNDVHYTYAEDAEPHDVLLCLQTGKKLSDENRMRYEGGQYFVKSEEEMRELFPYAIEAIENTQKIADRCSVEIEFGVTKLPKFDLPKGISSFEYLRKLCYEGLKREYGVRLSEGKVCDERAKRKSSVKEAEASNASNKEKPVALTAMQKTGSAVLGERMEYELRVIEKMGYVDYFLIVWDFIRHARERGIMVGPGRGSAAGSLVSYTLGITRLDPLRYQLLFERFLNPERVSMPDIDVDFCYERRGEVIEYVLEKYGKDHVAQIVTFGTLAARGVIRDVGRVMDLPYVKCDQIAKMVPNEPGITIDRAMSLNRELRKLYETDESVTRLIDLSKRLEGLPRHTSMHAAGVVICQKAVDEYVPLSRSTDGSVTTQFPMTTLESLGLLKMDFLGLRTLTVIRDALKNIEQSTGVSLDPDEFDYDDRDVLSSLGSGKCEGIFQLESQGMKSFMKELKPESIEDLIAGISLYRPGPMDFIPDYIRGKNHPETITYACPQLKPILAPTYGCIVYQEQVMQIVRDLAGYTLGRSDLVRRAMSKKKGDVMAKERANFVFGNKEEGVPGCISRGISESVANKIFDEMTDFAKYAFNKSHAAAYAVVSYQTAYLKYHYPMEFMAALMTSVIDRSEKVAEYIRVCRQMGIDVLSPNVNRGMSGFCVSGGAILYGLSSIKGVGRAIIDSIVREREEGGEFRSLHDFLRRMSGKDLNKRVIENFIKSGALDSLEGNRRQKMMIYECVMEETAQEKKNSIKGQMSLADFFEEGERESLSVPLPDVAEYEPEELLAMEKDVLGIYVSGHPLERYEEIWHSVITHTTADLAIDEESGKSAAHDGEIALVGGILTDKLIKYTKKNQAMAFFTIEDMVGSVEIIAFPRDFENCRHLLEDDARIFVRGRISEEEDKNAKLICQMVYPFDAVRTEIWLKFADMNAFKKREGDILNISKAHPGEDRIMIYVAARKAIKELGAERGVRASKECIRDFVCLLGEENVRVRGKLPDGTRKW